ncbi:MAG: SRPBCC family protein [Chloroflexi bacterium]|nr:SRPBCC family protein [Chloroflexota bacterium]
MIQLNQPHTRGLTVGRVERWGSMVGGGALILYGLTRRSLGGVALALLGGDLVYHGLARNEGHLHEVFGFETAKDQVPAMTIPFGHGFKIERSVRIDRSPEELYQFWRDFENLPRFMDHVESVHTLGDGRSHWVAKAPAGLKVEWDAEIINDIPNELIAWRSVENADVPNAGSVHFDRASDGHGTKVSVILKYDPPAGPIGAAIAKLFGEAPSQTVRADLYRLKQLMEIGHAPMGARL